MSAINPASFQTPAGGLQLPGSFGLGPASYSADTGQHPNRQQQRRYPTSSAGGPNQTSIGAFDQVWVPSRESNTMNIPQLYAQTFQPSNLAIRQLDQYPPEYRQSVQQMLHMHSPYNAPGYNGANLHHSTSYTTRPRSSNGGSQAAQAVGRDWHQSFQGLSLGH